MMGETGKVPHYQVKVDNWSIFFLQRLHHFYRKDYHCDLTLVFSTLNTVKTIKVHRLVLHACTDYFESMEVTNDSELGECLQLSTEMHPDVVIPIISFMYTGKLEFPASLQSRLYEAASKLRMTILTKLLDAQPKQKIQSTLVAQTDESFSKTPGFQCNVTDVSNTDGSQTNQDSYMPAVQVMQIMPNLPASVPPKQVEDPFVTLTPITSVSPQQKQVVKPNNNEVTRSKNFDALKVSNGNSLKTKVPRRESVTSSDAPPKPKIVDVRLPPTLPGRKLPIWKRKVPFTGSQSFAENASHEIRSLDRIVTEAPRPTRFEWDEDLNDPTYLRPVEDALRTLAHDVPSETQYPIILDGDVTPTRQKESNSGSTVVDSGKRNSPISPESPDSPPYKKSKTDLQDMKEYGEQQQLRNEILCNEENSEDGVDPDDLYGSCDEESQDAMNSQSPLSASTPKPILKSLSKPEPSQPASKRVRFSLEGKENNSKPNDIAGVAKKPCTVLTKQKIVLPMNVNQIRTGGHHVKIVSEVLKKYPNLTRRDNVKLKIVSKLPAAVPPTVQHAVEGDAGNGNKSSSSHVSYIYLMNENPNQASNIQMVPNEKDKEFDVENRTGPWICNSCDASNPIEFDSYYNYRRHLVEVHEMKIDARICQYCGLRSSKRNHLLYHLYTKHGIDPPAHVSFPKCSDCEYIALSDALLIKHRAVHDTKELLTCYVCNVVFRSFSSMQSKCNCIAGHLNTNYHIQHASVREGKQIYRCPYCEALFADGDKLGKHIVSTHWGRNNESSNEATNEDVFEQSGQELQYNQYIVEQSSLDNSECCETQESSDLESLNNVATGIVTSLNLVGNEQTVVYYEQQPGNQDIGREATVMTGEECKDFIIPSAVEDIEPGGEYTGAEQGEDDSIGAENEDSNSRNSTEEEVNPTCCSDHDYSEPQADGSLRQVIPVQQVSENYQSAPIIQQILPEQQLVFTSQPSVMFQPSAISLPQRVLLAPGNVVLSQISHLGGQNVILPQVIPQTGIILSKQIIQPTNLISDTGNAIVFANSEVAAQEIENVESITYAGVDGDQTEMKTVREETEKDRVDDREAENKQGPEQERIETMNEEDIGNDEENGERTFILNELMEESGERKEDATSSILNNRTKSKGVAAGGETAKIVDDWDESNENSQSVESRSDGPSRPEFF